MPNTLPAACSPSHTCKRCEREAGALGRGALIPCARCPLAYHLECMPEAVLASRKTRVWLASSGVQHLTAAQIWPLHHGRPYSGRLSYPPMGNIRHHSVGLSHLLSCTYQCNDYMRRCSSKADMLRSSSNQVSSWMAGQQTGADVCRGAAVG